MTYDKYDIYAVIYYFYEFLRTCECEQTHFPTKFLLKEVFQNAVTDFVLFPTHCIIRRHTVVGRKK
jgi:hypothetical protein